MATIVNNSERYLRNYCRSTCVLVVYFYRAMLRRAQYCHGKSSVQCTRLSVTLRYCDHLRWYISNIISWLISIGSLLFADPNIIDLLQRELTRQIIAGFGVQYESSGSRRMENRQYL